jgi:L-threonylcarbamoyladenylate synthase
MLLEIMAEKMAADISVSEGAAKIAAGELLAFPTETVYGLGADACNDAAVARIFAAKGRPADHPLIVHVAQPEAALHFAAEIPDFAQRLIDAFWPGPLTVILPRKAGIATSSAGARLTPSHANCYSNAPSLARMAFPRRAPTNSAKSAPPRPSM